MLMYKGPHRMCERLLDQALNCSHLADVRFIFDDGKSHVSGHRAVLSAVSETFECMFRSGMAESATGDVQIRNVSRLSFVGFLEWLYLGEILVAHARLIQCIPTVCFSVPDLDGLFSLCVCKCPRADDVSCACERACFVQHRLHVHTMNVFFCLCVTCIMN
jgi:hypothetical protein